MGKAKKRIEGIFREINLLKDQIEEIVDEQISPGIPTPGETDLYDDAQWFYVSTAWDCPKSSFGWCMYHIIHDKAHDNCVFCHDPQERK